MNNKNYLCIKALGNYFILGLLLLLLTLLYFTFNDRIANNQTLDTAFSAPPRQIVESYSYGMRPNVILAKVMQNTEIIVKSSSDCNFVIEELNVDVETPAGSEISINITPQQTGRFDFYCDRGDAKINGQRGFVLVQE